MINWMIGKRYLPYYFECRYQTQNRGLIVTLKADIGILIKNSYFEND